MKYCIIEFVEEEEVEVIPIEWLKNKNVEVKELCDCWWPPYNLPSKIRQAITNAETVQQKTWLAYKSRVLGIYSSYEQARLKLPISEETSNLESDVDRGGKRKKYQKCIYSSSSDEEVAKSTKIRKPTLYKFSSLPSPPLPPSCNTIEKSSITVDREINVFDIGTENCVQQNMTSGSGYHGQEEMWERLRNFFLVFDRFERRQEDNFSALERRQAENKLLIKKLSENMQEVLNKVNNFQNLNSEENDQQEDESPWLTKMPLSEENIDNLEAELESKDKRDSLRRQLYKYGGGGLKMGTVTLLRKTISNEAAENYSWIGGKKKKIFSSLKLCDLILDAVRKHNKDATNADIANVIKVWLKNAKSRNRN